MRRAHNTYLEYLFNLGAIGLGLYLILMGSVISVIKKGIDASEEVGRLQLVAFLFGLLSVLVATFFGNLFSVWQFVWPYTGLMVRVAVEASTKKDLENRRRDIQNYSGADRGLPR